MKNKILSLFNKTRKDTWSHTEITEGLARRPEVESQITDMTYKIIGLCSEQTTPFARSKPTVYSGQRSGYGGGHGNHGKGNVTRKSQKV